METWNNLVDRLDLLLERIKLASTVKIGGREIPPVAMGFALIALCIPIWTYLEFEGDNILFGALVAVMMAWAVAQLGSLGLGDGVGEKPDFYGEGNSSASGAKSESAENPSAIEQSSEESRTQPDFERLALYAFAGVLAVLAVLYLMRNVDRYERLNAEFRYRELVNMVEPAKDSVEEALLSGSAVDMDYLDSGEGGLPDEVLVSESAHGISVIDGQIIATWMNDESDLDGVTYILTPKVDGGRVEWATTGTCRSKKAC